MSVATLAVQKIVPAGLSPSLVAADEDGDQFANGGRVFFHINNASAAPITATIDSVQPCSQGVDHNVAVSVPAGAERLVGPFDPRRFNNSSGRVAVTYSAVTSVTVGAFEV